MRKRFVIECQSCGKKTPIDRETCKYCGAPISKHYVEEGLKQYKDSQKLINLKCPVCESNNVQRLSLVYSGGTSDVNLTTVGGMYLVEDGIGIGIAGSSGVSRSYLASQCAPPREKTLFTCGKLFYAAVTVLIWALFLFEHDRNAKPFAIILTLIAVAYIFYIHRHNKKANEEYKIWKKTFICLRCGEKFIP